jgi:hypothetical protein
VSARDEHCVLERLGLFVDLRDMLSYRAVTGGNNRGMTARRNRSVVDTFWNMTAVNIDDVLEKGP